VSAALVSTFAAIARDLAGSLSPFATLQRIVDAAPRVVPSCDAASVSVVHGEAVETPAWSAPRAAELDTLQYASGEGPCLDAISKAEVVYAADLASDERWPSFGPRSAAAGAHSLLSVRLGTKAATASLNMYADPPGAYDDEDRNAAVAFAAHAGFAYEAVARIDGLGRELAAERRRLRALQRALPSRGVVALAEGILMQQNRTTAELAFAALRDAALRTGKDVAEIADYVVRTRRLPSLVAVNAP
jgi:GAF domain-containing protein